MQFHHQYSPQILAEEFFYCGVALSSLNCNEEAVASYDQALQIKLDQHKPWYGKACFYALWGKVNEAVENLQRAIELDFSWREYAKTDSDFDNIRQDERFRAMVGK
ncbi:MAG: hypothetical protein IGS48_17070 [Oscillatoriales cyanobacterium C42_A2020_001]|nr:hypothetical protein [Leptolyngbyaceae cyanobacterium C42_A2020_001]